MALVWFMLKPYQEFSSEADTAKTGPTHRKNTVGVLWLILPSIKKVPQAN